VNNLPGKDFTAGFLKRHRELSIRTANLIKRSRAGLSQKIINSFFGKYEKSAASIEPCNIYNLDETNLHDNPGAQKAIFRRGVKCTEQVVMANLFLRLLLVDQPNLLEKGKMRQSFLTLSKKSIL